jgi:phage gpG-like protein
MGSIVIESDASKVTVSLQRFALSLQAKAELLNIIGIGMLKSIYLTFREQGVPAGSWAPLAESTKKRYKRAGHKLLILSGNLRNSIRPQVDGNVLTIGTGLAYAAVQQYGSRDRGGTFGPRTREMDEARVKVGEHERIVFTGPRGGRYVTARIRNKNGKMQTVRMRRVGPSERGVAKIGAHDRHQNIPARPYLVFRPEDPARIQEMTDAWIRKSARASGLEAN